ncbi:DUF763 domain-containing protein [Candidatus Woesearchaeota archaeon]|nr:DUF763 domain-containing protein [Candidatus Woesearchaeota archaeon]
MRTGTVNLPLHTGKCPKWLFPRMKKLSGVISEMIVDEYGSEEFIRRLSNPYFFQALSCVIGFDWHSSGTTTTTCGALKESINSLNLGITIAGGKGAASRKTPSEIENSQLSISTQKLEKLKYASKITAKVDTSLVQDSYNLYHHVFIFTEKGRYAVIQQGMNDHYARRYHWLSDNVGSYIEEPHEGICCDKKQDNVLDMTSKKSRENKSICLDIVKDNPKHLERYIKKPPQMTLDSFSEKAPEITFNPRHDIIDMKKINIQTLQKAYEIQPENYEQLLSVKGVGPKTIRSLAMIADIVHGKPASWKDPVKYSFAHGGKDCIPYPVDKKLMDNNTQILRDAVRKAKLGKKDRLYALKRLTNFY